MSLVSPETPGAVAVLVTSLECTSPSDIVRGREPAADVLAAIVEVSDGAAEVSERYYRDVGADWLWVDRLGWRTDQWVQWTERPEHHLLELTVAGESAGYAELDEQGDGSVELAFFGVLQAFHGQGLGGWLLGEALAYAFTLPNVRRVWVHTCTLDSEHALANYQARGMRVFATETQWRALPLGPRH